MIFENLPSPDGIEKLNTSKLHELFLTKLMELYQGEMSLLDDLTLLQETAYTDHLRDILNQYQRNKGDQVDSLQHVFVLLDFPISGKNSAVMSLMIEECRHLAVVGKNIINDFAIGSWIMRTSHHNQAVYEWLFSLAIKLQMSEIKSFLEKNFELEKEIDGKTIMAISE